jgi:hypothetical protein
MFRRNNFVLLRKKTNFLSINLYQDFKCIFFSFSQTISVEFFVCCPWRGWEDRVVCANGCQN